MKSDEARIAEAVASLRHRLDSWGVEDPHDKAHCYVNDMLRAGWRPRSRALEEPLSFTERVAATDDYRAARDALKSRPLCSHGIDRTAAVCHEPHDVTPPPPGPVERDGTPPRTQPHTEPTTSEETS